MKAFLFNSGFEYAHVKLAELGVDREDAITVLAPFHNGVECQGMGPLFVNSNGKVFIISPEHIWIDTTEPAIIKPTPSLIVPKKN
jgi:hypothetical protein